ncbi:MAG: O-antigen ligase family protein [Bacteroidetes bacterium]|nr:O-antigen ligase family protein [Bacteroidota bacterium]
MFDSIKYNLSYILVMASWSVVGMISTDLAMLYINATLILFFHKERYFEALFGFFFLIILSDNTEYLWNFAKVIKPYYLLLMGILVLTKSKVLISDITILKRYAPYLIIALICLQFSVDPGTAIQKTISYALILLVVPNIVLYEWKRLGPQFFSNLIAFSIIIHFISISVLIVVPEVGISHGGRWQGMFGNPNGLGIFLILWYILYSAVNIEFPDLFTRKERIFYLLLTLLFLWMSGSRTALLSISMYELALNGFKYSRYLTLIVLTSFFIYFDFLYEGMIGFLVDLGLSEQLRLDTIEEGSGRYIAWWFTWEHIKYDSFFLGKGMGYDEYLMRSNYAYLSQLGHEGGVHNTYLIVWINTGLIGLLAFMTAFLSFFVQTFRTCIYSFPALLAIVISAYFEPWLSASLNPYTVIFLIILILITRIHKNEKALA